MMNAQLFPNLPEQREGPITVDGRTLAQCPACSIPDWAEWTNGPGRKECAECNGGGVVLVRA